MSQIRRIDVHHHPSPPGYLTAREGNDPPAPVRLSWTVEKSLQTMDEGGCDVSILSLPHAASIWGDHESAKGRETGRKLAREWNDFMKKLCTDHPGRFGLFATVPMLDVEGSLRETEYALDQLGADGVFLMTNKIGRAHV